MTVPSSPGRSISKRLVFIHSELRSGSTWLSYVLGSHPSAAHLGEYYRPFVLKNHTACRLCEAKGLSECEILHGIEHVEQRFHDTRWPAQLSSSERTAIEQSPAVRELLHWYGRDLPHFDRLMARCLTTSSRELCPAA